MEFDKVFRTLPSLRHLQRYQNCETSVAKRYLIEMLLLVLLEVCLTKQFHSDHFYFWRATQDITTKFLPCKQNEGMND